MPIHRYECLLVGSRAPMVEHLGEWLEDRQHRIHAVVLVAEVPSIRLLERLVPHLAPQDGHTDELGRHEQSLLDEGVAVRAHGLEDARRAVAALNRAAAALLLLALLATRLVEATASG